jgi:Leucine-rich repeat (LRR) protein
MGEASGAPAIAPKLLELDKEDVKAVRSFLPGKVLGRTAALLALVVLVLCFAGSLDVGLEQFLGFRLEPPWLKYVVLIGLPVLIVGAQILAEWQAERKRKRIQALAVKVDAVPEGYFGIWPYLDTPEDRAKFDRADRIHEKVLEWLRRADATPLYLTGDSGSGKSSVLNAYALPALREAGWTVVEARAWQDPETSLTEAVGRLAVDRKWRLSEAKTLRERFELLARRADEKLLLVLDQFEEFFILAGPELQKAFTALVEDLRLRPIQGLKVLRVLRSDYKMAVDELGLPLLRQGENWQEVGRFTTAAGTKFVARSGIGLQPDALDRILTSASELDDSPGMIRPVTLNVVGHVLSQGRASAASLDAGLLVRHYIKQSVEQPAIREFAPRVLTELVTEQGTKRPRSERDLVDQTGLRAGEVRAVMNGLWGAALARPLDAAQGVWELSHDFVARAVSRYLERWQPNQWELISGYTTLALLGLMVPAGVVAFSRDPLQAQLADLGVYLSSDGREASSSTSIKPETWTKVDPLLSGLTGLQSLKFGYSSIANLEPLKNLIALRTVDLSHTQVAHLGPLTGLTTLQSLDLASTDVADLAPLKSLTVLKELDLRDTQVADLGPLYGLTALQSLNLSDTQVTDIGPLKGLTALQSLFLSGTEVADLGSLQSLTALQSLGLSGTKVADLAPLESLAALQSLDLSDTQVTDLAPLNGLTALQSLDLTDTNVVDLGPLKGLTALRSLKLSGRQVTDIGPLKGLTALQSLVLTGTEVADLGPLQSLTALRSLSLLLSMKVADLRSLKGLTSLQSLDLSVTQVANVEPLKGLVRLESLDLSNTKVANLESLKGLTALKSLNLSGTKVVDLTPVQDLGQLHSIRGAADAELRKLNAYRAQKGLPVIRSR